VERTFKKKDASLLVFEAPQVISRVEKLGDLFAPVMTLKQRLPDLKGLASAVAKEPERIEVAAQADEDSVHPRKTARKKAAPKKQARRKSRKI
jgi:bifunctional non-homologous end joining protein LigD